MTSGNRSTLPPMILRHQPVQNAAGVQLDEAPSHYAEPIQTYRHDELPRSGTRSDIQKPNSNHCDHRRPEPVENTTSQRQGYSPYDPRRKYGPGKWLPVRPDVQGFWSHTAPRRFKCRRVWVGFECCRCNNGTMLDRTGNCPTGHHRGCRRCPGGEDEIWVEETFAKGKKGGKRGRGREREAHNNKNDEQDILAG
jgi:hypothetical protein